MANNNMKQRLQNASKKASKVAIKQMAIKTALKYGVPANLVLAMIQQESGFNPNAVSGVGAQGLMQLMPPTARELGVKNPFDPQENLDGGVRYIKKMLNMFGGDVALALAAYNAGAGRVIKAGRRIPKIGETQNYVKSILGQVDKFTNDVNDFIIANPILTRTPLGIGARIGKGYNAAVKSFIKQPQEQQPTVSQDGQNIKSSVQSSVQPNTQQPINDTTIVGNIPTDNSVPPQSYQIGNMAINPDSQGVYQFEGTPTGLDPAKMITQGIETIPTLGGVIDTVNEKVTPQITGQLDKYGNFILENTPNKADVQALNEQQRADALNLIQNAPDVMRFADRLENARREAMAAVASDPRLQNQGYSIDPNVYDNLVVGNANMNNQVLGADYYLDRQRLQYEANIANQMGVPYADYIRAKENAARATVDMINPYGTALSNFANSAATNYQTQAGILNNNQARNIDAYNTLNNGMQTVGAYGANAGQTVASPYNTAIPTGISANTAKGNASINAGIKDLDIQADMTKSFMQPQGGVDMVELLKAQNDAARIPYQNLESQAKANYYGNMGGYFGSMIPQVPNTPQRNIQSPFGF